MAGRQVWRRTVASGRFKLPQDVSNPRNARCGRENWQRHVMNGRNSFITSRSHKLGFEKALKQKPISQGSLCSEALIHGVNGSTCVPLGEGRHSKGERGLWPHYLRSYLLSFPQQCLPNRWHKSSSRQKRDNFYTLLKFLTLSPPRPWLPARLDVHALRPRWVCIAVISFTSWNPVLQTQACSHKSNY